MAVLVGTALCATLPSITAAHAAAAVPTVSLAIDGAPVQNGVTTVSGTMNVAITVTPVPGVPIQSIFYELYGSPFSGTIPVQPGQCDTTCTIQQSFDTTALLPYATGGYQVPAVHDGRAILDVSAQSATGNGNVGAVVAVDNHRPSPGQALTPASSVITATKQLTWTIRPTVSPTAPAGTTVSDVELEAPDVPGLPVTHFTRNADGSWTVTADTSSVQGGDYWVAAVAMDSNGVVSNPQVVDLVADQGFTLSAPSAATLTPDWERLELPFAYTGNWNSCGGFFIGTTYVGPHDVELQVDGQVWQDSAVTSSGFAQNSQGQCLLPAIGSTPGGQSKPLPIGKHTLTWVVTDDAGVQESVSQQVTVGMPLTSNWPAGPETLIAGSTLHLTPTISSPDGVSTLQSWTVTNQSGAVLASGTGSTAPALTLPTSVTQETGGQVTLNLVSNLGLTTSQSLNYQTGWQTAAFAHLSATSVAKGAWVRLASSAWARVAGKWVNPGARADVEYQWSVPGSGVWHNGPGYSVGATTAPLPATWLHAGRNACFRVVYTQINPLSTPYGSTLIPATSAPVCLTVKP